jgi:acetyl esterase/lipase
MRRCFATANVAAMDEKMHTIDRRVLLAAGAASAGLPQAASAQPHAVESAIPLWPGRPPGSPANLPAEAVEQTGRDGISHRVVRHVAVPTLTPVLAPNPNGAALLIAPGGGYVSEWFDHEGFVIAERMARAGVSSFILRYRLPGDGWADRAEAALQDAQRAMRLIRANAAAWRVDPGRVAAMGFSAGGHLAASLATRREAAYSPVDAADSGPVQPNLSALIYPVIELAGPAAHRGSAAALLGPAASPAQLARYSPNRQVDAATPPTFMVHAADDEAVPVENTLAYVAALRAAKVVVEAHIFEEGGHGFGIRETGGRPVSAWPELFVAWSERRGFLAPARA